MLGAATQGETLLLSPGGSWTAIHGATLEDLVNSVSPEVQKTQNLKIDMADVRELDTLGAWLLEKLSRKATKTGHPATVVGVAGRFVHFPVSTLLAMVTYLRPAS